MNRENILKSYMRRRCNGLLAYPRTVFAHLEEIKQYAPDFLTQEDFNYIYKFKYKYDKNKKNNTHSFQH